MREQIDSVPGLVEDAVICVFEDSGRFMESNRDTEVISKIQAVISRALPKTFLECPLLFGRARGSIQLCTGHPGVKAFAAKLIEAASFHYCTRDQICKALGRKELAR